MPSSFSFPDLSNSMCGTQLSDVAKEGPGTTINRVVKLFDYLSRHIADNKPLFDNPNVRQKHVFSFRIGLFASLQNGKIKILTDGLGKLPMPLEKLWHHTNNNTSQDSEDNMAKSSHIAEGICLLQKKLCFQRNKI